MQLNVPADLESFIRERIPSDTYPNEEDLVRRALKALAAKEGSHFDDPQDMSLPFFAYGIFRPKQIAYFQIKKFVRSAEPAETPGMLKVRDGLPILDPEDFGSVPGVLLEFSIEDSGKAYKQISALEPKDQYRWGKSEINGITANVLWGKSPKKGSVPLEASEWDGWEDPLFTSALEVVEESLKSQVRFEWDLKPTFRIQMAYLLLWSSIERYLGLRYHFREDVSQKLKHLALESAFAEALRKHAGKHEPIYKANDPDDKCVFNKDNPKKAVDYYYQVRSNITHRGKGVPRDHDTVLSCGREMLNIFRDVLEAAKADASA